MTEKNELSIAEALRRGREARGETLEQVQQRLGVSMTILKGIEAGDFSIVEPIYARLAIWHYAEHVGLGGDAMAARFEQEVGLGQAPVAMRTDASTPVPVVSASPLLAFIERQPLSRLAGAVVLLILLLVAAAALLTSGDSQDQSFDQPDDYLSSPLAANGNPPAEGTSSASGTSSSGASASGTSGSGTSASGTSPSASEATTVEPPGDGAPPATEESAAVEATSSSAPSSVTTNDTPVAELIAETPVQAPNTGDGQIGAGLAAVVSQAGDTVTIGAVAGDTSTTTLRQLPTAVASTIDGVQDPSPRVMRDQAPTDQAPADQAPADQAPADQAAADQAAADQAASDQAPSDRVATAAASTVLDSTTGADQILTPSLASSATTSGGEIILEARAIDSTWVQVQWDGVDGIEEIIPKGQVRQWTADRFFLVRAGRAHGVHFRLQGMLLGDGRLGDATKVLRFRGLADGYQLLGPELEPLGAFAPISPPEPAAESVDTERP